jgi:uncharacterized FlgJ-related protein
MEILWNLFVLFILPVGIISFILFFVMKAAVESAQEDLQAKQEGDSHKKVNLEDFGELAQLRDLKVLSDIELEGLISFYQEESLRENERAQYKRSKAILTDLKEKGYFSEEQYNDKIKLLNENR